MACTCTQLPQTSSSLHSMDLNEQLSTAFVHVQSYELDSSCKFYYHYHGVWTLKQWQSLTQTRALKHREFLWSASGVILTEQLQQAGEGVTSCVQWRVEPSSMSGLIVSGECRGRLATRVSSHQSIPYWVIHTLNSSSLVSCLVRVCSVLSFIVRIISLAQINLKETKNETQ